MNLSSCLSQGKVFNHWDRFHELIETGECLPVTIQLDPTNQCNRNCETCSGNRFDNGAQLSFSAMRDIIDQTKSFCRGIIFTGGGEPLCNEHTVDAIHYAKQQGIDVALVTNGDLLDETSAKALVADCSYIRTSIVDDRSWKNAKVLVEAKKLMKDSCTIGTGFLTNKDTNSQLSRVVEKASECKVDYLQFRPYHLDIADERDHIRQLQEWYNHNAFRVIMSEHKYEDMWEKGEKRAGYPECLSDWIRTVIAADGRVYADCHTRGLKEFCFGDLDRDDFMKIWKSRRRKSVQKNKLKEERCPAMSCHDPLDKFLWETRQQCDNGVHKNFL